MLAQQGYVNLPVLQVRKTFELQEEIIRTHSYDFYQSANCWPELRFRRACFAQHPGHHQAMKKHPPVLPSNILELVDGKTGRKPL